jgi:hypothetical protein
MAPTPLSTTDRYISPEVAKTYFVPTIADLTAPTRLEIDAGTDLTAEIAAMTGWEVSADRVAVPDLGTRFTGRISGRVNPGDAQIVFYASQDTADVRDLLARGDAGHIWIGDGGDVPTQKARVFEVDVSAVTPTIDVGGTEGARVMVDFSTKRVAEETTIPA